MKTSLLTILNLANAFLIAAATNLDYPSPCKPFGASMKYGERACRELGEIYGYNANKRGVFTYNGKLYGQSYGDEYRGNSYSRKQQKIGGYANEYSSGYGGEEIDYNGGYGGEEGNYNNGNGDEESDYNDVYDESDRYGDEERNYNGAYDNSRTLTSFQPYIRSNNQPSRKKTYFQVNNFEGASNINNYGRGSEYNYRSPKEIDYLNNDNYNNGYRNYDNNFQNGYGRGNDYSSDNDRETNRYGGGYGGEERDYNNGYRMGNDYNNEYGYDDGYNDGYDGENSYQIKPDPMTVRNRNNNGYDGRFGITSSYSASPLITGGGHGLIVVDETRGYLNGR